ncbi:metallopeptidase TldD-related protein [Oceanispirochaeta sp. M1]|uniref:metallopeptidase TldD-related protein n=2 Tax=Oceanispirochaeta TaxID=2035349 RepID=UPI0013144EC8|nr:metallopeptidase TldD-related protein [Oceanispirochaeta sp. M1]
MKGLAEKILTQVMSSSFDEVCITLTENLKNELNIAHNKVSLMRSTESEKLAIMAIQDNRKVTGSTSTTDPEAVTNLIEEMARDVTTTPPDEANAVAFDQRGSFVKGTQKADLESLVQGAKNILAYRSQTFPSFQIEEGLLDHNLNKTTVLSSRGCELELSHGFYGMVLMGSSKDKHGSSSFSYTGGMMESIPPDIQNQFNIQSMMENSVQETKTCQIKEKFTGDVILMPNAVSSLMRWLFGQLGDFALMQDTSIYKKAVGEIIADEQLDLYHILEGPGVVPFNNEGFLLEPFHLLEKGQLKSLLPSYYGSRKLGLPHQPLGMGWEITSRKTSQEEMIYSVNRGALVGRLSMGSPAPNGDFSGVIKNSFLLEKGKRTTALSETMITGNIAQMLKDIVAISKESTNFGTGNIPWIQIKGLQFS